MTNEKFSLILTENYFGGFRPGDVLTCTTERPTPGSIAILESECCGRWPIPFDEAGPEIKNGARLVGMAVSLQRNLAGRCRNDECKNAG